MQIEMISHASVIVRSGEMALWTDPWLLGKAFNNSWTLLVPPALPPERYEEITHIWISHEHPDHFSVPTLSRCPTPSGGA